jgi:tetratricopeptide (TPR) repeat protein
MHLAFDRRWSLRFLAALAASAALLLGALPALGQAPAPAPGRAIGVASPDVDASLEAIGPGYGLWLRRQLHAAGFSVEPVAGEDLAGVLAAAGTRGLPHLIVPRVRTDRGSVEVLLALYAPDSASLLAVERAVAPTASIGNACTESYAALSAQLGLSNAPGGTPPLLDELASSSRAIRARDAGELVHAWRAVQGKLSPTSAALRKEIAGAARNRAFSVAERARVLSAMGDMTGAWSLLRSPVAREEKSPTPDLAILLAAGEVQLSRPNPRGAREYFERVLEFAPDDPDARLGLAQALILQKDLDGARAALTRVAELLPADPLPLELLAGIDRESPGRAARHLLEAAERAAARLDPARARQHYARAIGLDPSLTVEASTALGEMEEALGRPAEALTAYRTALDSGAPEAGVYVGIGRASRALGDASGAQTALEQAVKLAPNDPVALEELGALYTDSGRAADAVPLLRAASTAQADGGDAAPMSARRRYALALQASGAGDEALEVLSGIDAPTPEDLQAAAEIHLERGDGAAAQGMLRKAIALAPYDPTLRQSMAQALEAQGDGEGAQAELQLAALIGGAAAADGSEGSGADQLGFDRLVMSFAAQIPQASRRPVAFLGLRQPAAWKPRILRWIWPRRADTQTLEASLERALGARFQLIHVSGEQDTTLDDHIDQLYAFADRASLASATIATVNQVLATDAVFAAELVAPPALDATSRCGAEGGLALEVRMLIGRESETVSILKNTQCLSGGLGVHGAWNWAAFGIYVFALLVLLYPILRGWGTIVVNITLPARTKGFFSIHITKRADQVSREVDKKSGREKIRAKGWDILRRYTRHMAPKTTTFRWIPARKAAYVVTVGGPLMDARGDEVIGHFLEERKVKLRRRGTSELDFDFRPKECAIEVKVLVDGAPASRAQVSVAGDPSSVRYAREGMAYLYLGLGSYTIVVGSDDAVAEVAVDIQSLETAIPLQVDLGSGDVVFRNCPDAVDPYLQGDLANAADALERNGDSAAAHRLRAILYQQQGRASDAAAELEAAGDLGDAAMLRARGEDYTGSAELFEQAGDHAQAAETYRAAGRFADAARCYELVYDYHNALECWREVGDVDREITLLEKTGDYMDAARLCRDQGDLDRALTNLQQIEQRHVAYGEACQMIAEIVSERGDHDLAVAKFQEAMGSLGSENASVEMLEGYAGVLEKAGQRQEALSAYEAIRRRDARRTDVATRIENLKREIDPDGTDPVDSRAAPTRQSAIENRYELLEEIGRGGMGVVYKARDRRLGRVIALKLLPENLRDHPTAVELFEREARAAAALNHPNIVTVFDAGEDDGSYFISMELLQGRAVNEILQKHSRLSVRDVARIGVQICAGLNYAHAQRIVHRDIKTGNLFFTRDQVVKIMDFGIAKSMEEVRRATTVVGGTPYYMAPEQAAGEEVDHRADLYALGVTLFQMTTGLLPFRDGDVTYRHRHEAPPDPRELDVNIPVELSRLILRLMRKTPDERPASAAEVAAVLQALLDTTR